MCHDFVLLRPRYRLCAMLLLAIPLAGLAQAPSSSQYQSPPLVVPQIQTGRPIVATYRCVGGQSFRVTYWNATNGQSFALLPVQGRPMLLVNGMSADGVRYQAGFVTWWSKGRGGDLYDTRVSADKPVLRGCQSK
ncbi:MliC family protein [Rhodanobacter sp. MP7CTX1]|uniref:MliC family protein n=1 Tax=Rhodanobacter sp. MP7CTX1 TaxID=2723084 RepID=UPI0017D83650|nr:MliC family protein [Rhodanobacter sp. MP7CTX1]MBB6189127.1 membrane-bound inhibitor of C-type lysozyme [Rhodanobacter sp. MP7CTX1]